jgi:hypothetical protein
VDGAFLRPPLAISVDLIGETCRKTFVPEAGRALQPPSTVSLQKATGIVTDGVQATPENRACLHAVFSADPTNTIEVPGCGEAEEAGRGRFKSCLLNDL